MNTRTSMDPGIEDSFPRRTKSTQGPTEPTLFDAPFDNGVHARATDRDTSHEAAASVDRTEGQAFVLGLFRKYGAMTDEQLLSVAGREPGPCRSPSGLRSRRSELSKPNEERLKAIRTEMNGGVEECEPKEHYSEEVRAQLRREGFRSPLWPTGEKVKLDSGRMATVWGIAE